MKARYQIFEELDMIRNIRIMQKIRAALCAIINNNKEIIDKTKKIYFESTIIDQLDETKKNRLKESNEFYRFLT